MSRRWRANNFSITLPSYVSRQPAAKTIAELAARALKPEIKALYGRRVIKIMVLGEALRIYCHLAGNVLACLCDSDAWPCLIFLILMFCLLFGIALWSITVTLWMYFELRIYHNCGMVDTCNLLHRRLNFELLQYNKSCCFTRIIKRIAKFLLKMFDNFLCAINSIVLSKLWHADVFAIHSNLQTFLYL